MADWTNSNVPYVKMALALSGGPDGKLTVPSTFKLRIGSIVYLSANGIQTKTLQIDDILNATELMVRDPDRTIYSRFDCSLYTTILTAELTQPEQTNFFYNKEPAIADVYRILQDLRDYSGIKQGLPNILGNAWPVKLSDGINVLGTVLNPLNVTGTFAAPSGLATEATLIQVRDKLNTYVHEETPGGAINGVNANYTTFYKFKTGTTKFYLNGVRQNEGVGNDYLEDIGRQSITLALAPILGDTLIIDYIKD